MRKIFILTIIVFSTILGNAFAGVLDERITALETTVASQQSAIVNLQSAVADLQTRLLAVENSPAIQMGTLGLLRLDTNELNGVIGPHVLFEGVNFHIRSGTGETFGASNGRGNLIIGYNEKSLKYQTGYRSGQHNLVMGRDNYFWANALAGIVQGEGNIISNWDSVVLAGSENINSGDSSIIIGGHQNEANHTFTAIVGGRNNKATNFCSLVSGGENNISSGNYSSVNGGLNRQALGDHDWAAGSLWENY